MDQLTDSQSKALGFIKERVEDQGNPPTLRELCEYMGFKAIGSAQDVISALRRKGFLAESRRQAARAFSLTEKARAFFDLTNLEDENGDVFRIPCLGAVPAGNPLEAIENRIDTLRISASMLGRPRPKANQLFAVRTNGLSMVGAGIFDGDWLVVRCQNEADPGNIVVARVGSDVTCKRLMHDVKKGWFLKPENSDFSPTYARDTTFEIVGRVLALQRSF